MRSEAEMFDLILSVAQDDPRVRAVVMNGSRANPAAPRDCFQDYDIVYYVTDLPSYLNDPEWVDAFGERIIMQQPEGMELFPAELEGRYTYLMLFADGNRIDLMLTPADQLTRFALSDLPGIPLLDKDGILPAFPEPDASKYRVTKPSAQCYADCCNEFWWITTYVAKGLWRGELLYAMEHLNGHLRPMLLRMLAWKAGIQTGFTAAPGKCFKYLQKYLTDAEWTALLSTFASGSAADVWRALHASCALFRQTAAFAADALGYVYPAQDDRRVSGYLACVQALPADAAEIL